jgi:hypothetical protein
MVRHALAEVERHALRMVDEEADKVASYDLGEQNLNLRLRLLETGFDIGLDVAHVTSLSRGLGGRQPLGSSQKKRALRPLLKWPSGREKLVGSG